MFIRLNFSTLFILIAIGFIIGYIVGRKNKK